MLAVIQKCITLIISSSLSKKKDDKVKPFFLLLKTLKTGEIYVKLEY